MTGFWTLTLRELREGRAVLAAAAVAAVIPLGVQLLAGAEGGADIREITAWFVAVALAGGFGLLLGATVLARDLAEGRLGFYFAQPVSGAAIWTSKMLAAALLALMAGLLPMTVAFLAGFVPGAGGHGVGGGWAQGLAVVAGLAVLGVALGHAASVMVRSRSRWQVLDVTGLVLVAAGVWWVIGTLRRAWAPEALTVEVAAVIASLPLALLVAGAVQTTKGRTEIVRGHRLLSVTLWSVLGMVTLLLVAGAHWVVTPAPDDLVRPVAVAAAPEGPWVAVGGESWGRGSFVSVFLVDSTSHNWLRLPMRWYWPHLEAFSADGHRAVWVVPGSDPESDHGDVVFVDLGAAEPILEPTTLSVDSVWSSAVALDAEGGRLVVASDGNLSVSTVPRGDLVAAARLPAELFSTSVLFVGPDRVRVYGWKGASNESGELWIGELDVAARHLEPTGTIPLPRYHWSIRLDADAKRLTVLQARHEHGPLGLFDARTGEPIGELTRPGWSVRTPVAFLADGGIAVAEERGDENRLRVLAPDGGERLVELPPNDGSYWPGSQPEAGTLNVVAVPSPDLGAAKDKRRAFEVDLASGKVQDLGPGTAGVLRFARIMTTRPPGSVGTRLIATGPTLELLDPSLKSTTVIAGSR